MKTILVDAWKTLVTQEGIDPEIRNILDSYKNKKIILTNANPEEKVKYGIVDMPYEVFSLEHDPEKDDPEFFQKLFDHFHLKNGDVVYIEHGKAAVESARSVGIPTYHYDMDKKDLSALKEFLDKNL